LALIASRFLLNITAGKPPRRDQTILYPALPAFLPSLRIAAASLQSKIKSALERSMPGNRNILFLIIGALFVAVGVLGYNLYLAKQEPKGMQINVGPDGLKIQSK
jgi:hypothetical protein